MLRQSEFDPNFVETNPNFVILAMMLLKWSEFCTDHLKFAHQNLNFVQNSLNFVKILWILYKIQRILTKFREFCTKFRFWCANFRLWLPLWIMLPSWKSNQTISCVEKLSYWHLVSHALAKFYTFSRKWLRCPEASHMDVNLGVLAIPQALRCMVSQVCTRSMHCDMIWNNRCSRHPSTHILGVPFPWVWHPPNPRALPQTPPHPTPPPPPNAAL